MDIYVYLKDQRVTKVTGCTGDPSQVIVPIQDGYYRDIFSLTSQSEGLFFSGTKDDSGGTPKATNLQVPAFISGGVVPAGVITINQGAGNSKSEFIVSDFNISVTDEVAHAPLRQVTYNESYWAFPVSDGGVTMNMLFRQAIVEGWGNAPNDI